MSKFVEIGDGRLWINAERIQTVRIDPVNYGPDNKPMAQVRFSNNPHERPLMLTWPEWHKVRAAVGLDGTDTTNEPEACASGTEQDKE